jgi:hypothetical protein
MELEVTRTNMIKAFHAWSITLDHHVNMRKEQWEDYVKWREAFLKQDAYEKGYKYIPLSQTLIIPGPYGHYN